jgi:hypothetical protein
MEAVLAVLFALSSSGIAIGFSCLLLLRSLLPLGSASWSLSSGESMPASRSKASETAVIVRRKESVARSQNAGAGSGAGACAGFELSDFGSAVSYRQEVTPKSPFAEVFSKRKVPQRTEKYENHHRGSLLDDIVHEIDPFHFPKSMHTMSNKFHARPSP